MPTSPRHPSPRLLPRAWAKLANSLLRLLDFVGLCASVALNVMLMRRFGLGRERPDWLWHFLPVMLYFTAGARTRCMEAPAFVRVGPDRAAP